MPHFSIVNAIAPGVWPSEMTRDTIEGTEMVNKTGDTIVPIPADRAGT